MSSQSPPSDRRDWRSWHEPYDDPDSHLSRRLRLVQDLIREALGHSEPGMIRAISVCAGQGRDLLEVLRDHPRSSDVRARLVELDEANVSYARSFAYSSGLKAIEVIQGDASISTAYDGAIPADLVLVCGVFGNVPDADVRRTIRYLPAMCAPQAKVIWTRHRKAPDLTIEIRHWFAEAGFEEAAFVAPEDTWFGIGTNRFIGRTEPFERDVRLFSFFR